MSTHTHTHKKKLTFGPHQDIKTWRHTHYKKKLPTLTHTLSGQRLHGYRRECSHREGGIETFSGLVPDSKQEKRQFFGDGIEWTNDRSVYQLLYFERYFVMMARQEWFYVKGVVSFKSSLRSQLLSCGHSALQIHVLMSRDKVFLLKSTKDRNQFLF